MKTGSPRIYEWEIQRVSRAKAPLAKRSEKGYGMNCLTVNLKGRKKKCEVLCRQFIYCTTICK